MALHFILFFFHFCYFTPSIFATAPVVDLTYAQYQGVPTLDPVNNETITHFLGIRYDWYGFFAFKSIAVFFFFTIKTGS